MFRSDCIATWCRRPCLCHSRPCTATWCGSRSSDLLARGGQTSLLLQELIWHLADITHIVGGSLKRMLVLTCSTDFAQQLTVPWQRCGWWRQLWPGLQGFKCMPGYIITDSMYRCRILGQDRPVRKTVFVQMAVRSDCRQRRQRSRR